MATGAKEAFLFQTDGVGRGEWGQEDGKSPGFFLEETIDNLGGRSGEEGSAGLGIVGGSVGGKKNAEVVVNFRGGGERGAGATPGVALFDGEGGREALDRVDGRSGEAFEVEPGVGGEAFEVTALAFGVDGVERQRGFSGTGRTREDDETVLGDIEIKTGEIMLTGAADAEEIAGSAHGRRGGNRAGPGLGGRGGRGIDVDAPVAAVEADVAVGKGEKSVIATHADVIAGVELGAALADENGAGGNELAAVTFYAKALAVAVAAVACRSLTFFMCHDGLLG